MSVGRNPLSNLLLALAGLTWVLTGCLQAEPTSTKTEADRKAVCEYWPAKLSVASKEDQAFKLIGEAKCKNALPELEKMFDNRAHRETILKLVRVIGDRSGAIPILKRALSDAKLAKQAAVLVGRWKVKSLLPQLLGILETEGREGDRLPALNALLEMTDAKTHEDLLIKLAWTDLNIQSRQVSARAIKALEDLKSKKAAPYLVVAAFLQGNGQQVYQEARRALATLGKHAVGPLASAANDKLDILKKMAGKTQIPHWSWTTGHKITQLLSDTLHEDAALPLAKNIALSIRAMPRGVEGSRQQPEWINQQKNRLNIAHLGLGHIGSEKPIPVLEKVIMDELADARAQRIRSARALAYIGTPKAIKALFRAWDLDHLYNPGAAAAAAAEKASKKKKRKKKKRKKKKKAEGGNALFLGYLSVPLAIAVGPQTIGGFDQRLKNAATMKCSAGGQEFMCVQQNVQAKDVQAYLAVVRECKSSVDCYVKELLSKDKHRVIKAALILARGVSKSNPTGNGLVGDKAAVIKALIARLRTTKSGEADVRRFVLMALTRLGDANTGKQLEQLVPLPNFQDPMWKVELPAIVAGMKSREG